MLLPLLAGAGCSSAAFDVAGGTEVHDGLDAEGGSDDAGADTHRPGELHDAGDGGDGDVHVDADVEGGGDAAVVDGADGDAIAVDGGGAIDAGDAPAVDGAADGAGDADAVSDAAIDTSDAAPTCVDGIETKPCNVHAGDPPCCAPLLCDPGDGWYCVACFALSHGCDPALPGGRGGCCTGGSCVFNPSSGDFRCTP